MVAIRCAKTGQCFQAVIARVGTASQDPRRDSGEAPGVAPPERGPSDPGSYRRASGTGRLGRVKKLRVPAALVVAVMGGGVGCGDGSTNRDAGTGECQVICFPDFTDAGVCPDNPRVCVSETLPHSCPSGCTCSLYCFPRTAEGSANCPTDDGLDCAAPDRTCPAGCDPVA
jgi:hypothetical protein